MDGDRVKSSQSPEIAPLWPLQDIDLAEEPAQVADLGYSSVTPTFERNRTISSHPTRYPELVPGPSQGLLYQDSGSFPASPVGSGTSSSQNTVFQQIASEIPYPLVEPSGTSLSTQTQMREESFYFPQTPSQIIPSQPITFEAAFSQQMKEPRGMTGSSSSSVRRREQIVLGDFSVLSGMGAVVPQDGPSQVSRAESSRTATEHEADSHLNAATANDQIYVQPSSRPALANRHLNSPTRRLITPSASGLPTPPFTDARKQKAIQIDDDADEDELENELRDLKRCTSKYGILSPPSSSTVDHHHHRGQGRRGVAESFDPFSAEYDKMDVEFDSSSGDENRGVQAGVPVTHVKSKQARLGALERLKSKRNRLDIPPVLVESDKRRKTSTIPKPRNVSSSDNEATGSNESVLQRKSQRPMPRPKKRRRIAGSSQTEPDHVEDRQLQARETGEIRKAGSTGPSEADLQGNVPSGLSLPRPENTEGEELGDSMFDQEGGDGVSVRYDPPSDSAVSPEHTPRRSKRRDEDLTAVEDVPMDEDLLPEGSHDLDHIFGDTALESSEVDLARMFDDDDDDDDDDDPDGKRNDELEIKVKSEKSLGKRPQRDPSFAFDGGNDLIDLTEEDMGDEYELDKYELTQGSPADEEDVDPDLDSMDEFDAFDWDPSQPIRQDTPEAEKDNPLQAGMVPQRGREQEEELIRPIRLISSLPEKLKQFYLTHWCRTTTRKPDELVGPAAQLANDRIVAAEVAASVDKRMRGKTWENTAPDRAGRPAPARGGKGGTRGGRGAARGKAFFIQRAMRAKRGRGRGR